MSALRVATCVMCVCACACMCTHLGAAPAYWVLLRISLALEHFVLRAACTPMADWLVYEQLADGARHHRQDVPGTSAASNEAPVLRDGTLAADAAASHVVYVGVGSLAAVVILRTITFAITLRLHATTVHACSAIATVYILTACSAIATVYILTATSHPVLTTRHPVVPARGQHGEARSSRSSRSRSSCGSRTGGGTS